MLTGLRSLTCTLTRRPIRTLILTRTLTQPLRRQVNLPAALTGIPDRSADPEVAAIQEELEDLSKRIPINDLQLPPEQERSPSPEPVYDKCVFL